MKKSDLWLKKLSGHNILKIIFWDIKTGILVIWKWMVFAVLLQIVLIIPRLQFIRQGAWGEMAMQICTYIWEGIPGFIHAGQGVIFCIPMEWYLIQISSLFVSAFYPVMDYNERGYQFLLRAGSRGSWWKSKLVWVVFSTIIFFMLLAGAFFCTELVVSAIGVSGGGSDLWRCIGTFSMLKKVQLFFILPVACAMTQNIIGFVLCMEKGIISAFIVSILLIISAVYFENPFLWWNYCMITRNKWVAQNAEMDAGVGLLYMFFLSILLCIWEYRRFIEKDTVRNC